ncbi:uncharacterized protein PFL1_05258 [Pseudozyma flocculosa PF-1]|uniref:Uncharacterized protein n=2 Tax=Pseudozyma flocculosa TaxID=84751 RepID=A0A5C3F8I8_9BASI|nr:uncharacterized protein PFL1_05258 [Pseudozyma flocculosa PF-1]EPQ27336.1 hypothetical protein PFL1_05258 [Pseudozyma flocculosa PF-1]SPO39709.1 uncharacterized protein PSFLO_05190 [Pseudozyma flocculosa]
MTGQAEQQKEATPQAGETTTTAASSSRPNSLAFPSTGGAAKHLNPAVRRAAEGGRHHQRSHSIDTKDRTSPILGFGPLQGDIAKFLSASSAEGSSSVAANGSVDGPKSPIGSEAGAKDVTSPPASAVPSGSVTGGGGQPLQKRVSLTSLSGAGTAHAATTAAGLARPIPRKASNGSISSSSGGEGSPEQASSASSSSLSSSDARPVNPARKADNKVPGAGASGSGSGGGASGLGSKDASKRTASPARGHYSGKPISPRLAPYSSGGMSGHARRISSELGGTHRPPSPIFLPSASPPTLPANPDPQHSWDSVWPRSPTSDRAQNIKRLGSPASTASSSSPSESAGSGSRPSPHSSPLTHQQSDHASLLSRSPRAHQDLAGSPYSTSPTIGRPKARRPHELRGSSSSPTLRVAGFPLSKEEPGSPRSLRGGLAPRQRGMETSKSEPIPRIGFNPVAPADGDAAALPAATSLTEAKTPPASGVSSTRMDATADATEPSKRADTTSDADAHSQTALHRPVLPILTASSATSPRSPFLQLSSPTTHAPSQHDMQLSESPPKTRSFIAMPPRSGYELSDDPDDVGSEEDGSSSGQGSVGTNGEDEDSCDEADEHHRDEDDAMLDESMADASESGADGSVEGKHNGDALRSRVPGGEAANGLVNGDMALDMEPPARPSLPKRPSLTRSGAVPAPPPVLDPLASAESSARALAVHKGSQGASLLTYFKDQQDQGDSGSAVPPPLAMDEGLQINDAVQPSALGLDAAGMAEAVDDNMMGEGPNGEQVEESLNTLERIFLFAKSDLAYHRVLVASSLPDWIRDVELSDAVEYIIPLLNGLGTDELDVCAAFAPELSRVMWFFFRNCPLAELAEQSTPLEGSASTDAGNAAAAAGEARPVEEDEVATRPRISVSTFTSLLCALLLNQNNLIAGATQQSLVQFFCRLENRELDAPKPDAHGAQGEEKLDQAAIDAQEARKMELHMDGLITHAVGRDGQPVPHEPYDFDERARHAIRTELLDNVAFAIARLSQEQARDSAPQAMEDVSYDEAASAPEGGDAAAPMHEASAEARHEASTAADPPNEEQQRDIAAGVDSPTHPSSVPLPDTEEGRWQGEQDGQNSPHEGTTTADADMMDESQLLESWNGGSSPFAFGSTPNMSEYKADIDEEAAVGRMASVSLLAALAVEELVARDLLLERLLPEVLALADDAAFFVRKEVAGALGPMAKNLDHDTVTERLLPAFERAMADRIWHVRLAACFSLPAILGRLNAPEKRSRTVSSLRTFVNDVSRKVRLAALEVLGEAIFMFKDDAEGVPDEMVRFFIGEPFDGPPQQGETSLSFDPSFGADSSRDDGQPQQPDAAGAADDDADSLLVSFGFSQGGAGGGGGGGIGGFGGGDDSLGGSRWDSGFGSTDTDPDRPLVVAFNIPAVVLTLGAERWPQLRKTYLELTEHAVLNVRKSLAASLHEIAKIIGPDAAKDDLLPAADRFLGDHEHEVRIAVLENIDVLLRCLPRPEAESTLQRLLALWSMDFSRDWRLRERLALHIPSMAKQFLLDDEQGQLVTLMHMALADSVSAVRDAGVKCVPDLYRTFADNDQVIADGFLGIVSDLGDSEGYRLRVACLLCIQALVDKGIQRSSCELLLVGRLVQMGSDRVVDVRIALARTVGQMCRRQELYASPQSRSPELNGLLARLARDRSHEVREAIDGILTPDEAARFTAANGDESPADAPRTLVLGPAEGGPHKPEGSLGAMGTGQVDLGQTTLPMFDMDESHDLEDVDMGDGVGEASGSGSGEHAEARNSADPSGDDQGHSFAVPLRHSGDGDDDDNDGHGPADAGDASFEEDEAPHHLLGVDPDAEDDEAAGAKSLDTGGVGETLSLSSPQRMQQAGQGGPAASNGGGDNVDTNGGGGVSSISSGSPSTKARGSDPFLAFVAGRRSQDLSRLKINFDLDPNLDRSEPMRQGGHASSPARTPGDASPDAAAVTATRGPTETALAQLAEDVGESLRSPGSSEDGSTGRRSAPSSGDWSQLRGDLPSSQQGAPGGGGGAGESVEAPSDPTSSPQANALSTATPASSSGDGDGDEDFVTIDADETAR